MSTLTPPIPTISSTQPVRGETERVPAPRNVNWSFVFIAICAGLFCLCVLLRLNGSSSAFWAQDLGAVAEPNGIIAGKPRLTRSDEWMMWTPAALAQLHHEPPMPVENPTLGAGVAPLLMSVPVRHYSMLFRPQFWGFFFFDEAGGFAWFWNAKLFGLLIAFFLLFRALLRDRPLLAIFGGIAVTYSSYVQWFFSCPPMLPDMLASWALALVAGRSLFDVRPLWQKVAAALVLAGSGINFLLCCYPPFQIPLLYLALTLFGVFLWKRGAHCAPGLLWLGGTALATIVLLVPLFLECRPTLEIIAQTSYPGARRGTGGTMPIAHLFSGLLNFFDGNRLHPAMFPNTSEASNFYPLWVAVLAGVFLKWRQQAGGKADRTLAVCLALAAFILLFAVYCVVGLPEWFCRATALNFCTERRTVLTIGIGGLLVAFLSLRADGRPLVAGRARFIPPLLIAPVVWFYLLNIRSQNADYLTPGYQALFVAVATAIGTLYFCSRPTLFAGCLAGALLANNFLVNPISVGLPLLLESTPARQLAAIHKADPTATWAVYERATRAQFLMASGARVLNGVKNVPDVPFWRQIDAHGANHAIYNRYAFILLRLPELGHEEGSFESPTDDSFRAFARPDHPALRAAGVKYVIFPRPLDPAELGPLRLIAVMPQSSIYIYLLPPVA